MLMAKGERSDGTFISLGINTPKDGKRPGLYIAEGNEYCARIRRMATFNSEADARALIVAVREMTHGILEIPFEQEGK